MQSGEYDLAVLVQHYGVHEVETITKRRLLSDNRVLVDLIEQGIEVRQQKERAFFELAERRSRASQALG